MAIIIANTPLVVSVPAGFRLQFGTPISGSCTITLPDRVLQEVLTDGEGLGPYQSDASVSITLTVNSTCWTIRRDGSAAILQAAHLAQVPFLSGVSVFIGESAAGPAVPAGWGGSAYSSVSGGGKRTIVPFKLYGQMQNSAGLLGITNGAVYEAPFDAIAVRVHRENMASTAQINCLASYAVGGDVATLSGPSATPSAVLFGGSQSHATTACTSGAGTNDAVPTDTVSDWLALPFVARTDGGAGRLFAYREYVPAAGNTTGNRVDIASTTLAHSITKVKAFYKSGDCVTTPANFTSPTEWTMAPAVWFEFLTAAGTIVVLDSGDSTRQGSDGGPMPNVGGAGRLASELLYGQVAFANGGWASQTSTAYYANALAKLTAIKPSVAFYCPWSPNDTDKYTAAGITRMQQLALQWIEACRVVGAKPVLLTPCPMNGLDSTQEGYRRQIVAWVKSVCSAGLATLADRDAVYTDYSTATGGFKAGLFATSLHPNPTGYAMEASSVIVPILATVR